MADDDLVKSKAVLSLNHYERHIFLCSDPDLDEHLLSNVYFPSAAYHSKVCVWLVDAEGKDVAVDTMAES